MFNKLLKKSALSMLLISLVSIMGSVAASAESEFRDMYSSENKHGWFHDNILR